MALWAHRLTRPSGSSKWAREPPSPVTKRPKPTARPTSSAPPCKANQPNAYLDGRGHLVLVAVKSDQTVTVGPNKLAAPVYTSARMASVQGFRYGRIEASIRLPAAGRGHLAGVLGAGGTERRE